MRPSATWTVLLSSMALLFGLIGASGCGSEVVVGGEGGSGNTTASGTGNYGGSGNSGGGTGNSGAGWFDCTSPAERVDVLLAIDNSRSMADKQEILALAVPGLFEQLINPPCVDANGVPSPNQPAGPLDECPAGYHRQFSPVVDMHIGVVSSSLGDHGGDVCPGDAPGTTDDDMARLITRDAVGGVVPTYQGLGFLAWDPAQQLAPPGEPDSGALIAQVTQMILGAGQVGCGFEAQLESWYRLLVDPDPYLTIEEVNGKAEMNGTDQLVLQQRRDFLRPDSLLLLVMLTDENDCSMRDGSQYFYAAKAQAGSGQYHLPRAQITCQTDPAHECCRSCGQSAQDCPPKGPECDGSHDSLSDAINLRCFDQRRRFGIDFLYPIERYVTGLTSAQVADRHGNLVPNPVYSDLNPNDDLTAIREPGLIFVAGIVGVPWQDLARRDDWGQPDLVHGLNSDAQAVGGLQDVTELAAHGTWDIILGDIESFGYPTDPLMIESVDPRTGTHPITGDPIAPPGAGYLANPMNGHEWSTPLLSRRDDLQYSCIFPLAQPRDCTDPMQVSCDCADANNDNPLCQEPSGQHGTTQYMAKSYPGSRVLWFLRDMVNRGIVGSICPAQIDNATAVDFGYRPSVRAILERVQYCL